MIKIFTKFKGSQLEEAVNDFIKDVLVVNIQYTTTVWNEYRPDRASVVSSRFIFSVMIEYEELKHKPDE